MARFRLSGEAWKAIELHLPENQAWRAPANAFCRPKDFGRVATSYEKLAAKSLCSVALVTGLTFWLSTSLEPRCCIRSACHAIA
jgi:transposase